MLMGPTYGRTCPGLPVDTSLGRCPVLSSSSCPSWPPKTDHRDGMGVYSINSPDLWSIPSADLNTAPSARTPQILRSLSHKLKMLMPLWGLQDPHQRQGSLPVLRYNHLCHSLHGAWTPAGPRIVPSAILRPFCIHRVLSLSETPMSGIQTGLMCSSHSIFSQGQLQARGSVGFCRSSLRVPSVLFQAPHLASGQDLGFLPPLPN